MPKNSPQKRIWPLINFTPAVLNGIQPSARFDPLEQRHCSLFFLNCLRDFACCAMTDCTVAAPMLISRSLRILLSSLFRSNSDVPQLTYPTPGIGTHE